MEAEPEEGATSEVPDQEFVPLGWRREVKQRSSGMTAGKFDVYYYNEHGRKFRSRIELVAYLRENDIQLEERDFDFSSASADDKRGSVLAKSSSRRVSVLPDALDNRAASAGKRSIRQYQAGIGKRLRQRKQMGEHKVKPAKDTIVCSEMSRENEQGISSGSSSEVFPDMDVSGQRKIGFAPSLQKRRQMDDHKVKPAKDTVVDSEMSRENEQDMSSGFSEGAAPESAKTKTVAYCTSNGTIDSGSFVKSFFVNASETQPTVVQRPTRSASSSESLPHLDVPENSKVRLSQLERRLTETRKDQHLEEMETGPEEDEEDASSELQDQREVPVGWRREVKERSSGMTAGKFDVYYYNEHGRKFRSRTELAAYLRENDIQLEEKDFDFSAAAADGKRGSVLAKSFTRPRPVSVTSGRRRDSLRAKTFTRPVSVMSHGRRDSVLAKSFTRPVSVTSDILDNWATCTGKRSIRLHQTWIDNRFQWRADG